MRAVNLIPAEERRGAGGIAGRSGGVVYVLPGGLAAVVVLGVVYAFAVHGVANRQEQLAAVTAQVTAVTAEAQELAPYVEFGSISAQQAQSTATLAQQRFDWPDAMEQLALALPSDVTISAFAALPASSSAAASTGGGPSFTLTGCASRQDEVATVLTDLAAVPGVTNVFVPTSAEIKRAKGKVSAKASEDTGGGCPYVTFTVDLDYSATYTVPSAGSPAVSSTGAQTVSSGSGGKTSIVQTANRQVTG